MKTKHITPSKQRVNDCLQETSISISAANMLPSNKHNQNQKLRSFLLLGVAVASSISLSSCVEPYGSTYSETSYNPYEQGYQVTTLPSGYQSETVSGSTYFYHNGNYYRRSTTGYVVTDAPRSSRYYSEYTRMRQPETTIIRSDRPYGQHYANGDVVTQLPSGYRVVTHRGIQYYQVGDLYYTGQNGTYTRVIRPY